jgi:hypothetical protein
MAEKPLTNEWKNLMRLVERLGFGEIKISVQAGKPVRVEIAIKSVKLDAPTTQDFDEEIFSIGGD